SQLSGCIYQLIVLSSSCISRNNLHQEAFIYQKNPPASVSQLGESVIRVHLPINCSLIKLHLPEQFTSRSFHLPKKSPSQCQPARGVSYQTQ
ncbi:hypothetical protein LC593_21615, partial [Nostoc sp. CHAB 5844]|nr:hypothetical protein [Nostoc sp. CHAB 5844]